jgi:hypothetical protein
MTHFFGELVLARNRYGFESQSLGREEEMARNRLPTECRATMRPKGAIVKKLEFAASPNRC